jgi:hypothetical protein
MNNARDDRLGWEAPARTRIEEWGKAMRIEGQTSEIGQESVGIRSAIDGSQLESHQSVSPSGAGRIGKKLQIAEDCNPIHHQRHQSFKESIIEPRVCGGRRRRRRGSDE